MCRPTECDSYTLLGTQAEADMFEEVKAFRETNPRFDMTKAFERFRTDRWARGAS